MLTIDKGKAIFISVELDAIRAAAKEELKRYDVTPAVRREVHILEDALDIVINKLGGKRPNRQGKEVGLGQYLAEREDAGMRYAIGNSPQSAIDNLEYLEMETYPEEDTKYFIHQLVPVVGEDVVVFTPAEQGSEEMIAERKREVAARKEAVKRGEFNRKVGNAPKYRLEGQ